MIIFVAGLFLLRFDALRYNALVCALNDLTAFLGVRILCEVVMMKEWLKNNYKKIWKVAKPIVLVGLLVAFFIYAPIVKIYEAVKSVNAILFGVSVLWGILTLYMAALKLWFFTKSQGLDFSANQIFVINLIVRFYSFFSPASIVGSGLKWYKLSSSGKEADALLAIAVSRAWDIFLAFFFGLLWVLMGTHTDFVSTNFILLSIAILIIAWWIALRYSEPMAHWLVTRVQNTRTVVMKKLFSFAENFFRSFSQYKKMSLSDGLLLFGLSIITEIVALFGYTLLAYALGIPISFVDLGWMRSIFFLSALAPFTLAGGIGLREASVVVVMSGVGIDTELAVAFSFLLYARSVLLYLLGGIVELFSPVK